MKNHASRTFTVDTASVNYRKKYNLVSLLRHFQDTVDDHAVEMGMDATTVWEKYAAIWIVTRIRVEIDRLPSWRDKIEVETYPLAPGIVRMERECVFTDAVGPFARLSSEWCLLDKESGRPRRPLQTGYPTGVEWRSGIVTAGYTKFDPTYDESEFLFSHTVRPSDLDLNVHMNNIAYARLAVDAFGTDEWCASPLKSFEIVFKAQSFEGEEIRIYKQKGADGRIFVGGRKTDGTRVFDTAFDF